MVQYDSAIQIALDITRGDRQRDYAHPLLNMVRIAVRQSLTHRNELKDGIAINPFNATLAMVDVKFSREEATPKLDNIVDAIGYTDMIDRMCRKLMDMNFCDSYLAARRYFDGFSLSQLVEFLEVLEDKFLSEGFNV